MRRILGTFLVGLVALSASAEVTITPTVLATYDVPDGEIVEEGSFDASGNLLLRLRSSSTAHSRFNPDLESFEVVAGWLSGSPYWCVSSDLGLVSSTTIHTGWADFCPDASFHATGWGGSDFSYGTSSFLSYHREVWGVASGPGAQLVALAGRVGNPCEPSAPTLEVARIVAGQDDMAEETVLTALQGTGSEWGFSPYTQLDYDSTHEFYWVCFDDPDDNQRYFVAFDASGVRRCRVLAPGDSSLLVHWKDRQYFILGDSSILTLVELDLSASVRSWVLFEEGR
ncbi:MAG: hypothetical protein KF858_07645 [Candidatus Sumerlaeia bacterium]|nr:hypothetical protein [Candidatus Sumerlaeia bacterium]